MMRRTVLCCALIALLVPTLSFGDSHEEAKTYAYGTYFDCDTSREWLADAIIEQAFKPVYDQAVEDGELVSWGYLAHHTGGNWRRVIYRVASTLEGALESTGTLGDRVSEANAQAAAEFGEICGSHDDYLWRSVIGSSGADIAQERGAVGFSTYLQCNEANEAKADEVVKSLFAPIYDAQVEAGNLVSWGYMEHWVGGEFRRLLTMTATDMSKLMTGRDAAANALIGSEGAEDFFASCWSHSDYIWNIQQETP